jgi:parallel beta-helix repeat protein
MKFENARIIRLSAVRLGAVLCAAALSTTAWGATRCVNPQRLGCFGTIGAAVSAASPNDVIRVSEGTYHEDVVIGKPLSLLGDDAGQVIIDATGLANGIDIDGHNHAGLQNVTVAGFTVRNANFEGILATDSSHLNISNNVVTGNDKSLQPVANGPPVCPGLPPYFAAFQGFDCGEGIHLSGVSHSSVLNNVVQANAGGILLSDDTGGTHDNVIAGNRVLGNPYDCSITLASHHLEFAFNPAFGVHHNLITGNRSQGNGLATGEGAGVGLFAAPPGAQTYSNAIIGNVLTGNGLPGVAMHSHSPMQNLNDNLIAGNQISGDGPDPDPGTTLPTGISIFSDTGAGALPINGTVITGNSFSNEGIAIAVKTPGKVTAHLNSFKTTVGIANLGTGTVDATLNYWGCASGPGAAGCATVSGSGITDTPFLPHWFGN